MDDNSGVFPLFQLFTSFYKRLTEKRFQWPRSETELKKLTQQEFRWLMEGLSITLSSDFQSRRWYS